MASVAILGGGISGLTAAYFLKKSGLSFTVFESQSRIGGKIKSESIDGYLVENGPNSLQSATPLLNQIIEETGLSRHQVYSSPQAKKRYVVYKGVPTPLPMSPPALISSKMFSLKGKLKLLKEPFTSGTPTYPETDIEESVASFVKRRLGKEILDYAVDPFVSGIFAGNPESLSIKHAFPKLHALEAEHGSLLKGMLSGRKAKKSESSPARRQIFSFENGLQMLPAAMGSSFPEHIRLNATITRLTPTNTDGWQLELDCEGSPEIHHFDAVISTLPLPALRRVNLDLQETLSPLWEVSYPPISVFALGFRRDDIDHSLDGFGMLVPAREQGARILGSIFSSTIFPNRAPEDRVLLTTLTGGARKSELCDLSADLLLDFVLDDLHNFLGVHADPVFVKHITWDHAIPQYNIGYGNVKHTLGLLQSKHNGLYFAGNYCNGIAVGEAMNSGFEAAQHIIKKAH